MSNEKGYNDCPRTPCSRTSSKQFAYIVAFMALNVPKACIPEGSDTLDRIRGRLASFCGFAQNLDSSLLIMSMSEQLRMLE